MLHTKLYFPEVLPVNELNDLSSLMKNPNFIKMLQNVNMQQNLQEKTKENNNDTNIMQILSNMALNNNTQTNNNANNNFMNLLPSLMGNNPNNISMMITLLNMILQVQNKKEPQRKKNENKEYQN